jgi:hypothetical protein
MTPWFIFSILKCNNMTPNALKMQIREVWFKQFENFNPTHFGFNIQYSNSLFLTMKIPKSKLKKYAYQNHNYFF